MFEKNKNLVISPKNAFITCQVAISILLCVYFFSFICQDLYWAKIKNVIATITILETQMDNMDIIY